MGLLCRRAFIGADVEGDEQALGRVLAQRDHCLEDHGKQPPRQLARQAERASAVEDEQRSGFDGLSTRTRGWYRIAVAAPTQEEALHRAKVVRKIYKPAIKIEREFDQFRLAREFVPMEPLANTGHHAAPRLPSYRGDPGCARILARERDGLARAR